MDHVYHSRTVGTYMPRRFNTDKQEWEIWHTFSVYWARSPFQRKMSNFPTVSYNDTWAEPIRES